MLDCQQVRIGRSAGRCWLISVTCLVGRLLIWRCWIASRLGFEKCWEVLADISNLPHRQVTDMQCWNASRLGYAVLECQQVRICSLQHTKQHPPSTIYANLLISQQCQLNCKPRLGYVNSGGVLGSQQVSICGAGKCWPSSTPAGYDMLG